MACKTCTKIRNRIARWLGMEDLYAATRQADMALSEQLGVYAKGMDERLAAVENELRGNYQEIRGALNTLDDSAGKYLEDLNSRVTRCVGQIATLQESIRTERADRKEVAEKLDELSTEVGSLAEDLRRAEFPDFKPIDMTIDEE